MRTTRRSYSPVEALPDDMKAMLARRLTELGGLCLLAVAGLADLMSFLAHHSEFAAHQAAVAAYRERYGVDA